MSEERINVEEERLIEKYILLCVTISNMTEGELSAQDVEDEAQKWLEEQKYQLVGEGDDRRFEKVSNE